MSGHKPTIDETAQDPMTRTWVVWLMAMTCCALWGSAFACIKTGYSVFSVDSGDTAAQILFAGSRFLLAGCLTVAFTWIRERKILLPRRASWKYIGAVSVFQTTTSIQEQTLAFIPKIIAVFVAILIFGPWMLRIMVEYVSGMFINLPMYIG